MKPLYSTPVMFRPMNPQPNWVFLNEGDAPDEYEPGVFVWYAPYSAGEDGGDVDWRGEFHKAPYRPGERCLDKSTGKVVTVLSCEPVRVEDVTEEDCVNQG